MTRQIKNRRLTLLIHRMSHQIPVVEDKEKKTAVITGRGGAINVESEELSLGNKSFFSHYVQMHII